MPSTGRAIQLYNCLKYTSCGCVVISDGIQKYVKNVLKARVS